LASAVSSVNGGTIFASWPGNNLENDLQPGKRAAKSVGFRLDAKNFLEVLSLLWVDGKWARKGPFYHDPWRKYEFCMETTGGACLPWRRARRWGVRGGTGADHRHRKERGGKADAAAFLSAGEITSCRRIALVRRRITGSAVCERCTYRIGISYRGRKRERRCTLV